MRIKTIRLKNFQGYEDSTIELSTGFNVIIGRNNTGKSSVVRALQFVFYNEWVKDYVRTDCDEAKVVITLDSGDKIIRTKGHGVNRYTLKKKNGDRQKFENFGTVIPKEIQLALGMQPLRLDEKSSINMTIANQHDTVFLLKESGTVKAKILGRISELHFVDHALKELSKDRKNTLMEIKLKEDEIKNAETELECYKHLPEQEEKINDIGKKLIVLQKSEEQIEEYKEILNSAKEIDKKVLDIDKALDGFESIDFKRAERIIKRDEEVTKLNEIKEKLSELQKNIDDIDEEEIELDSSLEKDVEKYVELLKKSKTCPLCFNDITTSQIKKIVKEIEC